MVYDLDKFWQKLQGLRSMGSDDPAELCHSLAHYYITCVCDLLSAPLVVTYKNSTLKMLSQTSYISGWKARKLLVCKLGVNRQYSMRFAGSSFRCTFTHSAQYQLRRSGMNIEIHTICICAGRLFLFKDVETDHNIVRDRASPPSKSVQTGFISMFTYPILAAVAPSSI